MYLFSLEKHAQYLRAFFIFSSCTKNNKWNDTRKAPMKVIRSSFFPCYRCCCGQPDKFSKSWRILRGSFTKPCTQWGHISRLRDTLWDSWTWLKKRCVEESLKKLQGVLLSLPTISFDWYLQRQAQQRLCIYIIIKFLYIVYRNMILAFSSPGILRWVGNQTRRSGAIQRPKDTWWQSKSRAEFVIVTLFSSSNLWRFF